MQLDRLRIEDFEPLRNRPIAVTAQGVSLNLELCEVKRLTAHAMRQEAPFALILRAPRGAAAIGQGMIRLAHPELGEFELFLVPIGPDSAGMRYEITFN